MSFKRDFISVLLVIVLLIETSIADQNDKKYTGINFYQLAGRVLEVYPTLKIAEMEIEQAVQEKRQIESSLSWLLNGAVGLTHDLTGVGTPSDRFDINSSINRQLESGGIVSLSAGYRYEDSTFSFSPSFPNPAHTTSIDLSYRLPLSQGYGNPVYNEGVATADASYKLAKSNLSLIRISLMQQAKDVFYTFTLLEKRKKNAIQAINRTKKLSQYINKNMTLGLSEQKDQLQVKAQLDSAIAQLSVVQLQWNELSNSLNRLLVNKSTIKFRPILISALKVNHTDINELIKITEKYHPSAKIAQARVDIAQSQINSAKDVKKDNLDLVMSVGTRTSNGENNTGSVSEQDWAGAVSIQFKHLFDDRGVTAKYKQSLIEKNIAKQNLKKVNDDIYFTVTRLNSEISLAKLALNDSYQRLNSESLKLKEAEMRFRTGRADTAQLIQFQNEFSSAELNYQSQKIELNKRIIDLQIYSGEFLSELNHHSRVIK